MTDIFCPFTSHTTCKSQKLFERLVLFSSREPKGQEEYWICSWSPSRPQTEHSLTLKLVSLIADLWYLKYNDDDYLTELPVSACSTGETFSLTADSLLNWSWKTLGNPKEDGTATLCWGCSGTFSVINSPMWCEASICESNITPLARPIGILHSEGSTVSLLLKKMRAIPIYSLAKSKSTSLRTIV